jgi:hypothetical protein
VLVSLKSVTSAISTDEEGTEEESDRERERESLA